VVESSLGVPTGCAGKLRWQTAGIFGEAAMAEPWDGVGEAAMAGHVWRLRSRYLGTGYDTNHKFTQPCYFPLPLKHAAQEL
jgi:hypothetical protein